MSCFSCGKGFTGTINQLLKQFKEEYERKGTERYFYKESEKGDIKIVKKADFKSIYTKNIQPNLDKGAAYSHISEYTGVYDLKGNSYS